MTSGKQVPEIWIYPLKIGLDNLWLHRFLKVCNQSIDSTEHLRGYPHCRIDSNREKIFKSIDMPCMDATWAIPPKRLHEEKKSISFSSFLSK